MRAVGARELDAITPNVAGTAYLEKFVPWINLCATKFGINTPERMAMFLAQVGHESGEFMSVQENLNYSSDGLLRVFKKYFKTRAEADRYARRPAAIANRVYANRMGNGDEASGDGWNYRGRGLLQVTGKNNYTAFAQWMGFKVLPQAIAYLETPEGAVASAAWFWTVNNLNAYADRGDIEGCTRAINGGLNGLEHRKQLYNAALKILRQ